MKRMIVHLDCDDWLVPECSEASAVALFMSMQKVKEEGPYSARNYLAKPDEKDCPHTIEIKLVDESRINLALPEGDAVLIRQAQEAVSKAQSAKWAAEAEASKLRKELEAITARAASAMEDKPV